VVQIDASPTRIGATYEALPVIGDAGDALAALAKATAERPAVEGAARAEATRLACHAVLEGADEFALGLLGSIRDALPWEAPSVWDMTLLAYWASSAFPVAAGRSWLYPLGSGTLGYALPAALGAGATGDRTLAVTGDGGAMYGLSELAVLAQEHLPVTWLIVDDGGYMVLRNYQEERHGGPFAVDLTRPDFVAMAAGAGVASRRTSPADLSRDLGEALAGDGPNVVVLEASIPPPPGLS
jgi:acetolactate synthase-1/2/3 large subunit